MAGPSMGGKIFQQVKDGFDSETNLHKLTIQKYEVFIEKKIHVHFII